MLKFFWSGKNVSHGNGGLLSTYSVGKKRKKKLSVLTNHLFYSQLLWEDEGILADILIIPSL